MGTSYYRLESPLTNLKVVETSQEQFELHVEVSGKPAGVLIIGGKENCREMVLLFALWQDESRCPIYASMAREELEEPGGYFVTVQDPTICDEDIVISEDGEVFTVAQVKARKG